MAGGGDLSDGVDASGALLVLCELLGVGLVEDANAVTRIGKGVSPPLPLGLDPLKRRNEVAQAVVAPVGLDPVATRGGEEYEVLCAAARQLAQSREIGGEPLVGADAGRADQELIADPLDDDEGARYLR
jgi:hypothetical protein